MIASRLGREFEKFYARVSADIFEFAYECNFTPTNQQEEFFELVQKGEKRIAVKSGQGPGKTAATTIAGMWRTIQHQDAMTIVTAPTMRQCRIVWLNEARRRTEKAHPFIKKMIDITMSRIIVLNRTQWGVFPVTATNPEAAQGLHDANMTIIVEEASGVAREILTQFEGTASNPNAMIIEIGNPNQRDCGFFDCFTSMRHLWACLTFNAEDTARDYPHMVSAENHRYLAEKYGRDSDVYRVRVLGEFPKTDPRCVMSLDHVEACTKLSMYALASKVRQIDAETVRPVRQFGIDFARYGGDENVVAKRQGEAIVGLWSMPEVEPDDCLQEAFNQQLKAKWRNDQTIFVVDASGMGQAMPRRVKTGGRRCLEFYNNGTPVDRQYDNRITEAWFDLRDKVHAHAIYLPNDRLLIQQLTTRQYHIDKDGKFVLESKEDYMKRGFDSPDRAEAVALAAYDKLISTGTVYVREQQEIRRGVGLK